jgi:hypothetical protein
LRSLERKLDLARQALRTLDAELRAVGLALDEEPDEVPDPLRALVQLLRRLPPTPEVWAALRFIVERLLVDSVRLNDSRPEWLDVPPEVAAGVRDLLGQLIHVAFFGSAPRAAVDGAEAAVQGWGRHAELGTVWLAELCALFEGKMNPMPAPGTTLEPWPGRTDADRVGNVLRALRLNCKLKGAPLPVAFYRLTPDRLRLAEAVVRTAREKTRTRGRRPSPQKLACDFARAFGLHPPRPRDVNRSR